MNCEKEPRDKDTDSRDDISSCSSWIFAYGSPTKYRHQEKWEVLT